MHAQDKANAAFHHIWCDIAQVTHKRCGGALLPGLSDVLTVEFCPTALRYYYDCIQVHSNVSGVGVNGVCV